MDREHAIDILRSLRPQLEARGIEHAGLFGSVARGEFGPNSDVDVVVTPAASRRLDLVDLGGVQSILEGGFVGLEVDVVVAPVGRRELKLAIERERLDVF